jgi:hypothetical protein
LLVTRGEDLSRSLWEHVVANAFWIYACMPASDVIEQTRGRVSEKLREAHTSLKEQAEKTGAITLAGAAVAALVWAWTPIPVSAMTCIGAGGTLGLVSGLYFWSVRRQWPALPPDWFVRGNFIFLSLCLPVIFGLLSMFLVRFWLGQSIF